MKNQVRASLAILIVLSLPPLLSGEEVVMRVMRDELTRSMAKLRIGELEKPYYIAYRIEDRVDGAVRGHLGSLVSDQTARTRFVTVDVRVGDYDLDNTNFIGGPASFGLGISAPLPLDDNYKELRRILWLVTDQAYKDAIENYTRKKAALQSVAQTEELPDYSKQDPAQTTDDGGTVTIDVDQAGELVRRLSAVFRDVKSLSSSSLRFSWSNSTVRYLNSEGTSFVRVRPEVSLVAEASTQALDGMELENSIALFGRSIDDLPESKELESRIHDMAAELAGLRDASLLERYNGPVLFEGIAAAEVLSRVLAPNLLGQRTPVSGDARFGRGAFGAENPFLDKLGSRVLPRFLSIVDDPSIAMHGGKSLLGAYKADDEGTPSHPTKLVENGILRGLLTGRTPVRGIQESTGSFRGSGPAPSCVFVESTESLDSEALKARFLEEIRQRGQEYGIVVSRLASPAAPSFRTVGRRRGGGGRGGPPGRRSFVGVVLAYKIYLDGRQEPVRNVQLADISASSFRDILAVSENRTIHQALAPGAGVGLFRLGRRGGRSRPVASWVVPDLLFEELSLTRPRGEVRRLPVLEHPSVDR